MAGGKYLVTAPDNALPGSAYSLTVQVFGAISPVNVSAYLEGYNGYDTHLHQHIYLAVTPVVSISVLSASVLFWSTSPNDDFNYLGHHVAESADLVIAANVLQVLVLSGQQPADAERVARWLFRQRNGNGLFKTAWDTLAATEALLVYDNRPGANTSQVHLNGHITSQNTSQVEVQYHVTSNVGDSPYEVVPVVLDESLRHFKLMVCNRWLLTSTGSGVTVQQVTLPSGFRAHTSHLSTQSGVTRLVQNGQSDFTLYFSQIERDSSCYTVTADRVGNVAHTSPGHIYTSSFSKAEYQDITHGSSASHF
ncbi:hypothetical protein ACOMHN_055687 [Nucella lapillus]